MSETRFTADHVLYRLSDHEERLSRFENWAQTHTGQQAAEAAAIVCLEGQLRKVCEQVGTPYPEKDLFSKAVEKKLQDSAASRGDVSILNWRWEGITDSRIETLEQDVREMQRQIQTLLKVRQGG